jgi:hypothetical protein
VLAAGAAASYFPSAFQSAGPTVYRDVGPADTPEVDPPDVFEGLKGVSPDPGSDPGTVAKPNPQPAPTPPIVAGIDSAVDWEDHVLEYSGILFWDGSSGWGTLELSALDMNSGLPVAGGEYQVTLLPISAQRIGFGMRLAVPGDSTTPGPHTHDIKLIFERQPDGGWSVIENCPEPNRCFPAEETMKVKA